LLWLHIFIQRKQHINSLGFKQDLFSEMRITAELNSRSLGI